MFEPRRVTILGESGQSMAGALAARLLERGIEVATGEVGSPQDVEDQRLAEALASSDVAVDFCVVDRSCKAAALHLADEHLPPDKPLLSCCHATSATFVAASLEHGSRVSGFGLLPPWEHRSTVECAPALQSDVAIKPAVEAFWQAAGWEAVWVGDGTGLVLPRVVACLANEAAFALMEGAASANDIDLAMRLGTRYPRGPLAWANLVGLPAIVATLDGLAAEHGEDRYRVAPLLRRMAVAGRKWDLS
jgi:3-hydroxybutyryl-CoA dehydrogenase